jgi:TonB family protein
MHQFFREYMRYPHGARKKGIEGQVFLSFRVDTEGKIHKMKVEQGIGYGCDEEAMRIAQLMEDWIPAKSDCENRTSEVLIHVDFKLKDFFDVEEVEEEAKLLTTKKPTPKPVTSTKKTDEDDPGIAIQDSIVLKVLERNKDWKNMLVLVDLTGSMYQYTGQILLWQKKQILENTARVRLFTFFNDGDGMDDKKKIAGRVGGVYHVAGNSYNKVKKMALEVMHNGNGGDRPENNIEALLNGINKCPDCDKIVMVADNHATPRDLELLSRSTKPVHLILCGTDGGFNLDYLRIARNYNWSIHTIEKDLEDMGEMPSGKRFNLGKFRYEIRGRNIKPIFPSGI